MCIAIVVLRNFLLISTSSVCGWLKVCLLVTSNAFKFSENIVRSVMLYSYSSTRCGLQMCRTTNTLVGVFMKMCNLILNLYIHTYLLVRNTSIYYVVIIHYLTFSVSWSFILEENLIPRRLLRTCSYYAIYLISCSILMLSFVWTSRWVAVLYSLYFKV